MGEEPQAARPLSGEILPSSARPSGLRPLDAVDADYVTLDAPASEHGPRRTAAPVRPAAPFPGLATLSRDRAAPAARWSRAGFSFWLFGFVLVAASFWIAGGHALVSG